MKRLLLASALVATSALLAQTNSINSSGNVGIGTTSPTSIFEVFTGAVTWRINPWTADLTVAEGAGGWARDFRIYNTTATSNKVHFGAVGYNGTAARSYWVIGDSQPEATAFQLTNGIHLLSNGDVGIGTTSPHNAQGWDRVLDLNGTASTKLLVTENSVGVKTGIFSHYSWLPGGIGKLGTESAHPLALMAGYGNDVMNLLTNGNVGIGTTNPTHKLAVNGTIKAREVIVETNGWSDYVFADDYALQPLSEVETHIKTNRHLPGIPSSAQVAAEGISVGDMQAKLLAKIEELTLHQIAQEKLLKAQAEELTALRSEIRASRQP